MSLRIAAPLANASFFAAASFLAVSELVTRANDRRRAAEDLFWTLLNHPEFLFQH